MAVLIATAAMADVGVKDVIDAMVIPTSNALFDVGRAAPESEEAWLALRNQAVILAEAGRALTVAGRSRGEEWDASSQAMSAAADNAVKAIDSRDVDGVLDAGNVLIEACSGCHGRYLYGDD